MLTIKKAQVDLFRDIQAQAFDEKTAEDLCAAYSSLRCSKNQFRDLTRIVRTWSYERNISGERDVTRLVHLAIALGADFPRDVRYRDLAFALDNTKTPANVRVKECLRQGKSRLHHIWDGLTIDEAHARLAQCINYPEDRYQDTKILPYLVSELNAKYVQVSTRYPLQEFFEGCRSVCETHRISLAYGNICYTLCALIYGQYFMLDPLRKSLANCICNHTTYEELKSALIALFQR